MTSDLYDFRKPGKLAPELEQGLATWFRATCRVVAEHLAKEVQFEGEMAYQGSEAARAAAALARLDEASVSYRLGLGADETETLLVFPRRLTLALVSAMMGDPVAELPADRELSAVESPLFEYLVQHVILPVLLESWQDSQPPRLVLHQKEPNPKYTRMFPAGTNLVVCCFVIRGPFGEQTWEWLVPQERLTELFVGRKEPPKMTAQEAAARPKIEAFVREIPVELSVRLGNVELPLSLLAELRVGDLVVLDQKVSEPLRASVSGEERFRVWAGRVGPQQAIQVESLIGP